MVLSGLSLLGRALYQYRPERKGPRKPEEGRGLVPRDGNGLLAAQDAELPGKAGRVTL